MDPAFLGYDVTSSPADDSAEYQERIDYYATPQNDLIRDKAESHQQDAEILRQSLFELDTPVCQRINELRAAHDHAEIGKIICDNFESYCEQIARYEVTGR